MTRGDTLRVKIDILDNEGNPYVPSKDDVIRFASKRTWDSAECCIRKEIPTDTLELVLEHEDTKNLEQHCDYVYDIQITMSDGTVDTFITGVLSLLQEVE